MSSRVCPFWLGYWLACPARRLIHDPRRMLGPLVKEGMAVLDVGPARGFFTLPLARMVGPSGKVVCVDVQERMLAAAGESGLVVAGRPRIHWSHAVLFEKSTGGESKP